MDPKIFTVHLLCVKHCSKPEDETASKGNMIPALENFGAYFCYDLDQGFSRVKEEVFLP